ncbi:unnamed protein product [Lactuca saligna]|uniref:Proton pump-interactor 1 n=1 Tax=Lactuca saligna TaxID=75948 RepID=A0AA35UV06_LACSI|nr:unnamed protein product [Lactuca saligna]
MFDLIFRIWITSNPNPNLLPDLRSFDNDGCDLNEVGDAATVDGNVGGNGNSNVGGHGKDDTDDSSYVFVNGSIEAVAGDPADKGGNNVDAISPKSDSADEVDQFQKEKLGLENGEIAVDPLVLETNGIVNRSATVGDPDVKADKDEVNLENGSTIDPLVPLESNDIAQDVNGHLGKNTGEEDQVVKSTEMDDANGITNLEAQTDDIVSGITVDPESTLNPIESSQVTVFESESMKESESQVTITQSVSTPDLINTTDESLCTANPVRDTDCEVVVNDGQEFVSNQMDTAEGQVTIDVSSKPSEDLECQVTSDLSESYESPPQELEGQVTVDGPGKLAEDLEFQVTADESESSKSPPQELEDQVTVDGPGKPSADLVCQVIADEPESESPINEQECQVPVNGLDSIDSSVDNQESPVSVDVSESNGNHTEEVDTTTKVEESDGKSEEHQELSVVDSEVNVEAEPNIVCNGIEAEHQSELVSAPCISETNKAEETVIELEAEPEENPDSGLVLSEGADILTNGQVEKSDGILEMEETQISQTVADEDVPLKLDAEEKKSEETLEKQVEGSSETPVKVTEPVEFETNIQEMKEHVKLEDEIQESQTEVIDNVQDDMNQEDNSTESTIVAEAPLETETNIESIAHEDTVSQIEVNNCVDETQEGFQQDESAENVKILPSTDSMESQCNNENGPVIENADVPEETKVEDTPVEDDSTSRIPEAYVNSGAVIEFGSIGRHETVPNMPNGDIIAVPDVINGETKPASGIDSDNSEQNVDDKMSCPETEDMNGIQKDEIPTSSVEDSVSDAPDAQNEEEEEEAEVLPYNFLIRIPRFEDEMFKDQIRSAQLQVDEKTRLRDAIRVEIQSKRARLRAINEAFNTAKQEETAARRLVRLKRQEIDSVQAVINRLKNAESVGDINHRIYNMEHMIQHETLSLKDEKNLIREIKQLRTLREQLASNMGSQDEIQQAMDQKDQTEENMRTLRKELDVLKVKLTKAEAATAAVGTKYDELSRKERELQDQFRAADDIRQKAYAHLNSLKKQSYDKNKNFRLYKEDVMAARDFASRGDKDSLHRLCANQVEAFMEQWNNNDEFRNDYVNRCNMNATRRQKYFDGNSLGPDDVSHVLPPSETVDRNLVSIPTDAKPVSVIPTVKQETVVSLSYSEDSKPIKNVTVEKNQTLKTNDVKKESESDTSAADNNNKKEEEARKEEMELARKAEELRKQEIETKLKEQRRLEEKAKATEALERKKRIAEKAQLRAELRARKEAEQKEKEREKRMRKKEKKKAGGDGSVNGEEAASSESSNEATTKEDMSSNSNSVMKKKKAAQKPPAHFFSKQLKPKPVPPPASIRNRKRWHQWVKLALAAIGVLALFLLGNTGFFINLKVRKTDGSAGI